MKIYLVGGAVRDQLLGIADENTEKDWVVVDRIFLLCARV
jgi:tRNA nucleotidyltransferase (CCA-adding enzyme)